MKIASWNVNGINACINKGLMDFMSEKDADIYCFQEVKATKEKLPQSINGYHEFHSHAKKKGYSGVSIYSKIKPIKVIEGIGDEVFDSEGRVLTLEFESFFLIDAYFPHSHRELKRLDFKIKFDNKFLDFCKELEQIKPLIIASDFNVAHKEIDLKNPKSNKNNAGFTMDERNWFDSFIDHGFIDTFREFVKEEGHYTWWPYTNDARERNIGWRIDYFIISKSLKNSLTQSTILNEVLGSDHCPILLEIREDCLLGQKPPTNL